MPGISKLKFNYFPSHSKLWLVCDNMTLFTLSRFPDRTIPSYLLLLSGLNMACCLMLFSGLNIAMLFTADYNASCSPCCVTLIMSYCALCYVVSLRALVYFAMLLTTSCLSIDYALSVRAVFI